MARWRINKDRVARRLGCGSISETTDEVVHATASMVQLDLPYFSRLGYLGSGTFGCVFAAQLRDGVPLPAGLPERGVVVVKAMVGTLLDGLPYQCHEGALFLAVRVAREVHLACTLPHHPRFPQVYRVFHNPESELGGAAGTDVYICMEYATGGTLEALLLRQPIPPNITQALARGCVEAVAQLHAWGIAHRDVKLENMLVTTRHYPLSLLPETARAEALPMCTFPPDGEPIYRDDFWVLAADFGLARPPIPEGDPGDVTLNVATAGYQAPEVIIRNPGRRAVRGPLDLGKVDAWSLGVVLAMIAAPQSEFARRLTRIRMATHEPPNHPGRTLGEPDDEGCAGIAAVHGMTPQQVREYFRPLPGDRPLPPPPPPPAGEVVGALLSWSPDRRPTAAEVLRDSRWLAAAPCAAVALLPGLAPPLDEAALNAAASDAERVANVRRMVVEQVARRWPA